MFNIRLLPFIVLISFPSFSSLAKEATATVTVEGFVSSPTCSINGVGMGGFSQTVDMGLYSKSEVGNKDIDVPLIVNCVGSTGLNGISLSLSTLGNYGAVGVLQPGAIKTSLTGSSISLKWQIDDKLVDLSNDVKKQFLNDGDNVYDCTMRAKLLPMPGFTFETMAKGSFRSGINVSLHYN